VPVILSMTELPTADGLTTLIARRATALKVTRAAVVCFGPSGEVTCEFPAGASARMSLSGPVRVSCVAKLTTATLVLHAVNEGRLRLDDRLGGLLAKSGVEAVPAQLSDIVLYQLLDHSHGLDGADLSGVGADCAGRIDLIDICARLANQEPLHAPGAIYSYGVSGYLLLGALLEHVYDARYYDLLEACILRPIGATESNPPAIRHTICPSTGGALRLSARSAKRLLALYWRQVRQSPADSTGLSIKRLMDEVRPLPGHSSRDTGFTLGWRHQAGGWLNWVGRDASGEVLSLRSNPQTGSGLVVTGSEPRTYLLAEQLHADIWHLHDDRGLFTAAGKCEPIDPSCYLGTFADSKTTLKVEDSCGTMTMTISHRQTGTSRVSPPSRKTLRCIGPHAFLCLPAEAHAFHHQFFQFIGSGTARRFSYLWNGSRVWPRRSQQPAS
jgi:CubicO group peptidase (beta-lactamase class C family)